MLRLISAVLHQARGADVRDEAPDLRPLELALVVPLVGRAALPLGLAGLDLRALVPDGRRDRGVRVITTPKVDWLALSPTLALLGASGVALLGSVLVPWWMRRGFTAFVAFAGFVTAGVFAAIVFERERRGPDADRRVVHARPARRARRDHRRRRRRADRARLLGREPARPRRRVLRAARRRRRGHGVLRHGGEPDDALPRARVVLDRPLHPLRARHAPRDLARGRAEVPDRRQLRLGDPALRLGARLRRDRGARLLRRSPRPATPTTCCCSPASRC